MPTTGVSFRIAVVGAGAIGLYYGGKLAHVGRDVHFLMHGDLDEIRRDRLSVRGEGENFTIAKINCDNSTTEIGPCDLVLIAVKATSNNAIVDLIPPLLRGRTMPMTLQNGLGNEEFLADDDLRRSTLALLEEVVAAANNCGYALPGDAASEQMKRTETMGADRPSALLDFEARKPLEIEAIWGEPLRRAAATGAQTPRLETIYSLLKSMDGVRHARKIGNPEMIGARKGFRSRIP